jgi:hypothetical protein
MLQEQGIVFNQPNSEFKDYSGNIVVNNNETEKLTIQLEARIKNLEEVNSLLREKIAGFKKK